MPITAADITEYLGTRSDFDLELFVSRTLSEAGFFVSHGGTYSDPVTGLFRQYDIQANAVHGRFNWIIYLAVECKSLSADAPLLVSRVPRPEIDSYHELVHVYREPGGLRSRIVRSPPNAVRLYSIGSHVGKRTAQVRRQGAGFKDDDRDSHEKWSQALASAHQLIQQATDAKPVESSHSLILPILVVSDATLWVADYSERGVLEGMSAPVDETTLFVDRDCRFRSAQSQDLCYHISHLHICTRSYFPTFVANMAGRNQNFIDRMFGFTLRGQ